jgi:hypothetical protein
MRRRILLVVLVVLGWGAVMNPAAVLNLPPDAGAPSGFSTSVPILIDDATGVLGADLIVGYDPSVALPTAVFKTSLSSSHVLTPNLTTPGLIRISLFGTVPLSGGGALVEVEFDSVGPENSEMDLELLAADLNEGDIPADRTDGHYCVQGLVTETANLQIALIAPGSSVVRLTWDADPVASSYNLYRAGEPGLGDLACYRSGAPGPSSTDWGEVPLLGEVDHFLVSSVNCRHESTLGMTSLAGERVNHAPCP